MSIDPSKISDYSNDELVQLRLEAVQTLEEAELDLKYIDERLGESLPMDEQVTAKWSKNFMANNATPTGIVSFNGKITQEDFEKIKVEWARQYGGPNNAGKIAFIRNSEIEFTKIGSGYSDIALKDLKDISKEDIMFMFRVSKPILGIVDDVALNNGKNAR